MTMRCKYYVPVKNPQQCFIVISEKNFLRIFRQMPKFLQLYFHHLYMHVYELCSFHSRIVLSADFNCARFSYSRLE